MIRIFEPVLDDQLEVITLIEDLAFDVRVIRLQTSDLLVLLGDEFLVHRGYLDVHVVVGKKEVGGEPFGGLPLFVEVDGKALRLVIPGNAIEIEEKSELTLTVVSEVDVMCRRAVGAQGTPASITPAYSS